MFQMLPIGMLPFSNIPFGDMVKSYKFVGKKSIVWSLLLVMVLQ
jgi:hypothetical protein